MCGYMIRKKTTNVLEFRNNASAIRKVCNGGRGTKLYTKNYSHRLFSFLDKCGFIRCVLSEKLVWVLKLNCNFQEN